MVEKTWNYVQKTERDRISGGHETIFRRFSADAARVYS
jgi:hypothetical protein